MRESSAPTVLVTGATSGIGFHTARLLLAAGCTVIVHGPTAVSAEKAISRLATDGADPFKTSTAVGDFTRLTDVTRMASEIAGSFRRIDVLINNAAVAGPTGRRVTEDGNEVTFQVNYLAHYLLTRLLADRLAGGGRVINVSSKLHLTANLNWSDPQRVKNYAPVAAYAQSKLALTMFARSLGSAQPAVSVHPGIAEGGLLPLYSKGGGIPAGDAASAIAHLCLAELSPGAYYDQSHVAAHAPLVSNGSALTRLWKLSAALTGLDRAVAAGKGG